MTKFNHEHPYREADPGALIDIPESTRPSRWTSPAEQARKRAERVADEKVRVDRVRLEQEEELLKKRARKVLLKRLDGTKLTIFDQTVLERLKEVQTLLRQPVSRK